MEKQACHLSIETQELICKNKTRTCTACTFMFYSLCHTALHSSAEVLYQFWLLSSSLTLSRDNPELTQTSVSFQWGCMILWWLAIHFRIIFCEKNASFKFIMPLKSYGHILELMVFMNNKQELQSCSQFRSFLLTINREFLSFIGDYCIHRVWGLDQKVTRSSTKTYI